jgi:hypothetical protein
LVFACIVTQRSGFLHTLRVQNASVELDMDVSCTWKRKQGVIVLSTSPPI